MIGSTHRTIDTGATDGMPCRNGHWTAYTADYAQDGQTRGHHCFGTMNPGTSRSFKIKIDGRNRTVVMI